MKAQKTEKKKAASIAKQITAFHKRSDARSRKKVRTIIGVGQELFSWPVKWWERKRRAIAKRRELRGAVLSANYAPFTLRKGDV